MAYGTFRRKGKPLFATRRVIKCVQRAHPSAIAHRLKEFLCGGRYALAQRTTPTYDILKVYTLYTSFLTARETGYHERPIEAYPPPRPRDWCFLAVRCGRGQTKPLPRTPPHHHAARPWPRLRTHHTSVARQPHQRLHPKSRPRNQLVPRHRASAPLSPVDLRALAKNARGTALPHRKGHERRLPPRDQRRHPPG